MSSRELFFEELKGIQDVIITVTPSQKYRLTQKKIINTEELLNEAIIWLIEELMVLIDGYKNDIKYEIKNTINNIIINLDIGNMHDQWDDFLCYNKYMNDNKEINYLFNKLLSIKDEIVEFGLKNENLYQSYVRGNTMLLGAISFRTIYRIMELFDGELDNKTKYEIKDTKNNIIINNHNEKKLCDECWKYLI